MPVSILCSACSSQEVSSYSEDTVPSDASADVQESCMDVEQVFKGMAEDYLNKIRSSSVVMTEDSQTRAMVASKYPSHTLETLDSQEIAVDMKYLSIKRIVAREFISMKEDVAAGWKTRSDYGRLNVSRYVSSGDPEEAFDLWKEGNSEACDYEIVILLDASSSMNKVMKEACMATWAIKAALDEIDANTSVIRYNWSSAYLYRAKDRASNSKFKHQSAHGGTSPQSAIDEARLIFSQSKRSNKILVSITDGQWWGIPESLVGDLNKYGVTTAMMFLPTGENPDGSLAEVTKDSVEWYGHSTLTIVQSPEGIVDFVRNLVREVFRSRLK